MTKDHILDLIRDTSKKNGGEPLGWRRFFRETGVRESDLVRFWPRYSDAVREAGHTPKAMTAAFGEQVLVRRFVELVRELKRMPTDSDLRFRKNTDPTFPSASLFWRHLGAKKAQVEKVVAYCRDNPGHDDVLTICEAIGAAIPSRKSEEDSSADDQVIGSVYLLRAGRFYKIGRTNSSGRRGRELAIQLPSKAEIIHEIRTDDPIGIEAYWHRRFEAKRQNGEWFLLAPEEVRAFKRRQFM